MTEKKPVRLATRTYDELELQVLEALDDVTPEQLAKVAKIVLGGVYTGVRVYKSNRNLFECILKDSYDQEDG